MAKTVADQFADKPRGSGCQTKAATSSCPEPIQCCSWRRNASVSPFRLSATMPWTRWHGMAVAGILLAGGIAFARVFWITVWGTLALSGVRPG